MRCCSYLPGASGCSRKTLVAVPLICWALLAAAQAPRFAESPVYSLTCAVIDSQGHALPDLPVELLAVTPPNDHIRSQTGSDGSFTFRALHEGLYELSVAGGILLAPKRIPVGQGQPQTVTLQLPISSSDSAGHGDDVVSVEQLTVPRRIQGMMREAIDAWAHYDINQSRALAERILSERPDFGPALAVVGILDVLQGNPTKAVPTLLRALHQDWNAPRAYLALASAYDELRQNDQALDSLSLLAHVAPESWQLHYEAGRAQLGQGRYQVALKEFDRARSLDKQDNPVIHLGKAHALLGLREYDAANSEIELAIAKSPNGPYATEARELAAAITSHLKTAQSGVETAARAANAPSRP